MHIAYLAATGQAHVVPAPGSKQISGRVMGPWVAHKPLKLTASEPLKPDRKKSS
jgi:hypothetical protein